METNVVIQGDCLEVMRGMEDNCVDLVLTDPPYGIDYQSNMRKVSKKFSKIENDDNNMRFLAYREFYRILKPDTVAFVFFSFKNYAEDFTELSKLFSIKNAIVWSKGGGGIGDLKHSLLTDYEMAIVAHKGKFRINGKRIGSVWMYNKVDPNKMIHPTEKPVSLLRKAIRKFSYKNDVVMDCFLGSGATAEACHYEERDYIGIEISEEYCEIARKRVQEAKDSMGLFPQIKQNSLK